MKMDERRRSRLSSDDWIAAALDMLAEQGILGVRIDELARRLGVTKGSFYWHFNSRDELLTAMAGHWVDREVDEVLEEVCALPGDPVSRMELLFAVYHRRNLAPHDRAMRAWAQGDERAAEAVRRASDRVNNMLRGLFEEMGFDTEDAVLRARMVVLCGVGSIFAPEVPVQGEDGDEMRQRFLELITRPVQSRV